MTQFIIDKTCGNSSGKAKLGHLTVDLRNVATPGFLVHTLVISSYDSFRMKT